MLEQNILIKNCADSDLVYNIKANNDLTEFSIKELSERHSGLFNSIVNKITGLCDSEIKKEVVDDKLFILFQSAKNYDSAKGSSFSTHFANQTKWSCLKKKNCKSNKLIPVGLEILDHFNSKDNSKYEDEYKKVLISHILKEFNSIKDERAKKIIYMRYFSDDKKNKTWKKISEEIELSIQGCINIHNKYINKIKNKVKKHGN